MYLPDDLCLHDLPDDCASGVGAFLSAVDVCRLTLGDKELWQLYDSPQVWLQLLLRDYPLLAADTAPPRSGRGDASGRGWVGGAGMGGSSASSQPRPGDPDSDSTMKGRYIRGHLSPKGSLLSLLGHQVSALGNWSSARMFLRAVNAAERDYAALSRFPATWAAVREKRDLVVQKTTLVSSLLVSLPVYLGLAAVFVAHRWLAGPPLELRRLVTGVIVNPISNLFPASSVKQHDQRTAAAGGALGALGALGAPRAGGLLGSLSFYPPADDWTPFGVHVKDTGIMSALAWITCTRVAVVFVGALFTSTTRARELRRARPTGQTLVWAVVNAQVDNILNELW